MLSYEDISDEKLILFVKEGDSRAFAEVFDRYKVLLYKHAWKLLRDNEEVNDVIQELFLNLWENRDKLIIKNSLSGYLYQSIRNRILDKIKHQKVVQNYYDSIHLFIENGQYQSDEKLRSKELAVIIEKEIAALPPRTREIFQLAREHELTYKEIGKHLHISDKTVKQQIYIAVKTLKSKFHLLIIFTLIIFFKISI